MNLLGPNNNKKVTMIQTIVCFVCLVLVLGISFGQVFTMHMTENDKEVINDLYAEIGIEGEVEDTVEVSFGKVLGTVAKVPSMIKGVVSLFNDVKDVANDAQALNDDANAFQENNDFGAASDLKNDADALQKDSDEVGENAKKLLRDNKEVVAFFAAILNSFKTSFLFGAFTLYLIVLALIQPILLLVFAIIALIAIVKNAGSLDVAYPKAAKGFKRACMFLPSFLFVGTVLPDIELGGAVTGLAVVCFAGIILNLAASRLKNYTPAQFKYINLLQITSAAGLLSFLLFLTNFKKSGIFSAIFAGLRPKDGDKLMGLLKIVTTDKEQGGAMLISLFLCVVALALIASTFKYLFKCAYRLACMKDNGFDGVLVTPILGLIATVLFSVSASMIPDKCVGVSDEAMGALTLAIVAWGLVLATEIVFKILKSKLCADATDEDRKAVLTGILPEETAEEAVAEEAVAEEAVAEEAVAEEAVAEEAVAEEAVAEDKAAENEEV